MIQIKTLVKPVYEVVDDEEYENIIRERQNDDFVVDDGLIIPTFKNFNAACINIGQMSFCCFIRLLLFCFETT